MKINIYTIHKDSTNESLETQYIKFARGLGASIVIHNIFDRHIKEAQKLDSKIAKNSYSVAFRRYLDSTSMLLDSNGETYDSINFSYMLGRYMIAGGINFFIAGAFGFEDSILKDYPSLSLSKLTFSHEIAKIVLLEQIYRGLSIMKNHLYHKI